MNQKGISILTSMIIISSVALSIGLTVSLVTSSEIESVNISYMSEIAFNFSDICSQEAIYKLKKNSSYTGETINFTNGSCVITVTGATTKTITVTGTYQNFTRKIRTIGDMTTNPGGGAVGFSMTSWKELP